MKTVLFYKPFGVVSQFSALGKHATLAEFGLPPRVYPCGRLDHDSEGLLILTDDGRLQNRLSDRKFAHERTYLAQVEGAARPDALAKLMEGLSLKDGKTRPAQARVLTMEPQLPPRTPPIRSRKTIPTTWIELVLTEGRNRQVRRMTAAVGLPTLRLVRVRMGPLSLDGLAPGQWRDLNRDEKDELRKLVPLEPARPQPVKRF
jgi:23S rRNA pseudouridine2457 synthase